MSIDPNTYPSRAFIRFLVENQLMADLTGQSYTASVQRLSGEDYVQQITPKHSAELLDKSSNNSSLDQALLEEITKIAFNASRNPELYRSCGTQRAAKMVETRLAAELVETYWQIKQKQKCPIVEKLNSLL